MLIKPDFEKWRPKKMKNRRLMAEAHDMDASELGIKENNTLGNDNLVNIFYNLCRFNIKKLITSLNYE